MSTPATLLDDAFAQAIVYWKANNGGTRAGLIADLVAVIGITNGVAANWVDAFTAEVFNLGMSDATTYASFKTWLQTVGVVRAEAGVRCAFENLKAGTLINDARGQLIARLNDEIAITDTRISQVSTSISEITAQTPSTSRTVALRALNLYLVRLQKQREAQVIERDRLGALVV